MDLSLRPQQRPGHRMHTVTIEEILRLGEDSGRDRPALENYFSPTKKEQFIKDFLHYLNTSLLEMKHGNMDMDLYLVFVLSFQFITPLLEIHAEKEFGLFCRLLEQKYDIKDPDINLHFTADEYNRDTMGEEEALSSFRDELDESYSGRREVKEPVQKRLKQDGVNAIMKWQQKKGLPELAEAFGRCVVLPSFFSFKDKKLLDFYRRSTEGITYEVAVPEINSTST